MTSLFKKLFERKCGHDWEIIEYDYKYKCLNNIWRYEPNMDYEGPYVRNQAVRKICLKCGKRIDEIVEAQKQVEERRIRNMSRKERARKMWDESLPNPDPKLSDHYGGWNIKKGDNK